MKPYLETFREQDNFLHVNVGRDLFFKPHFHSNLEILVVNTGRFNLQNNGESVVVTDGQVAFNDSYDIHGYGHNDANACDYRLIIIPLSLAKKFVNFKGDKTIKNKLISSPQLCRSLIEITDRIFMVYNDLNVIKAGIDLFLALIMPELQLSPNENRQQYTLIKDILDYLNDNYKTDINLSHIAKHFGYTEAHISRVFHRYFGCSIGSYVNDLRISYVLDKINVSNEQSVTDIIFEAGFKSIQTYYRNLARYKSQNNHIKNA